MSAASRSPAEAPAGPFAVAVVGTGRAAEFWGEELAADPRFAPDPAAAARLVVPPPAADPGPGELVLRPARFTAGFAAVRSAAERLGGPFAVTFVEHTQTPLPTGDPARDAEHGAAPDRLESRLDELLAFTGWTEVRVTLADRTGRDGEDAVRLGLSNDATGGSAWLEIVRGAAVRWEPGWALRTPAGGLAAGTLATREPAGELAPRPWPPDPLADAAPLDALHAHLAGAAPWPVTAAQTATVRAVIGSFVTRAGAVAPA